MPLHAAAVIKAFLARPDMTEAELQTEFGGATEADRAAGVLSLSEINSSKACQWAVDNVNTTVTYLRPFWKCLN
jgi:hypothetical protein